MPVAATPASIAPAVGTTPAGVGDCGASIAAGDRAADSCGSCDPEARAAARHPARVAAESRRARTGEVATGRSVAATGGVTATATAAAMRSAGKCRGYGQCE